MTHSNATTEPPGKPLVTEAELGVRWRVSRRTLQRLRFRGDLPESFRVGRKILYRLDVIIAFEAASPNAREAC